MKAFVIYLPDRAHSVKHSAVMLSQLTEFGIDAELFEGTPGDRAVELARKGKKTLYPYSIKTRDLEEDDIKAYIKPELYNEFVENHHYKIIERQRHDDADIPKLSRPGVIGCFYSHYNLWKKCAKLGEPIMIFEDDVKFYRGYYPVEFEGVLILSLGKSSFLNEPFTTYLESPSGTPIARHWKNFSMPGASGYAITPDAAKTLVKFYRKHWSPADNAINQLLVPMQISSHLMGRNTLTDEGNVSMTKAEDWV